MILLCLFCSLIRRSSEGNGSFRQAIQKKNGSSRKVGGANNGLGEAPKSCTRKEHESATNSIAKRGQGGDFVPFRLPLAGSRDSVPCGVWGNAPTVPRPTSIANALNKGAGSEASLPLTLRVRRRAPKLLFPQDSVMNQKRRPQSGVCRFRHVGLQSVRIISACRRISAFAAPRAPPPAPPASSCGPCRGRVPPRSGSRRPRMCGCAAGRPAR